MRAHNSLRLIILNTTIFFFFVTSNNYAQNDQDAIWDKESLQVEYNNASNQYQYGNYEKALALYKQVADRYLKLHNWKYNCYALIGTVRCYMKPGKMDTAKFYLDKIDGLYKLHCKNDIELYLAILYNQSLILTDLGELKKSIDSLNKSILLCRKTINNDSISALLFNALGHNYTAQGKFDSALFSYSKAIYLKSNKMKNPDYELAIYLKNLGAIYSTKGNYWEAISNTKKSLDIYRNLKKSNYINLAGSYYTMANIFYYQGLYAKALSYYDSSQIVYSSKMGRNYFKLYEVYIGKANVFNALGDLPLAEEYYQKAIRTLNNINYDNKSKLSRIKYILGLIYYRQNNIDEAMICFQECMILNKKHNSYLLSNTYHAYAKCLEKSGDLKGADQYYLLAIENRIAFYGENHPALAYDYLNYGGFLNTCNDTNRAFLHLLKALEIYQQAYGNKHPLTSKVLCRIGAFYKKQNNFTKALDYYQEAIIASTGNFDNSDPVINPPLNDIIFEPQALEALKGKAETLFERSLSVQIDTSDLYLSLSTLNLASKVLYKIRTTSNLQESKTVLAENERDLYVKGMEVALKLYKLTNEIDCFEEALNFASKSKAALLSSSLKEADAKLTGNIPELYLIKETELKQKIAAFNKLIYDELQNHPPDSSKLVLWRDELFDLNLAFEDHLKEIEAQYPEYYQLKYTEDEVSLNVIRKKIRKKEAIIEYVVTDDKIYSFVITKNEAFYYVFDIDSSFRRNIDNLLYLLFEKHPTHQTESDLKTFGVSSFNVYKLLLLPFEESLKNRDLIIIPDGRLTYLPFEILISEQPEKNYFFYDLPFLLKNHAIGYVYTSSLFENGTNKNGRKASIGSFFPTYGPENGDTADINLDQEKRMLSNLGYTDYEKIYISSLNNTKLFVAEQAVENTFLAELNNWDILHLSMHGIVDSLNPLYSKLVFTNSGNANNDDMLHHYEIYNLKSNAKLIVLSACHSGYGTYIKGEGIISLAKAFFQTGCPGVVTALWSVSDQSGAVIIIDFYKQLLSGKSKIESLRLAKLAYLDQADPIHSHPHYWATHIVIGDPSEILHKNKWAAIYLLAGILVILVIYFAVKKRSQSSSRSSSAS